MRGERQLEEDEERERERTEKKKISSIITAYKEFTSMYTVHQFKQFLLLSRDVK